MGWAIVCRHRFCCHAGEAAAAAVTFAAAVAAAVTAAAAVAAAGQSAIYKERDIGGRFNRQIGSTREGGGCTW